MAPGANRDDSSPSAAARNTATISAATVAAPRSASFMRQRRRTCRMMPIRSESAGGSWDPKGMRMMVLRFSFSYQFPVSSYQFSSYQLDEVALFFLLATGNWRLN